MKPKISQFICSLAAALLAIAAPFAASICCVAGSLPSGYTEVEYIEPLNSAQVYIQTSFTLYSTDTVETKVKFNSVDTKNGAIWCSRTTHQNLQEKTFTLFRMGTAWRYDHRNTTTPPTLSGKFVLEEVNASSIYTLTASGQSLTVANDSGKSASMEFAESSPTGDYTSGCNVYLFASTSTSGSMANYSDMKMYYFTVKNASGTVIHHLVPCKNSEGTVGMYDTCGTGDSAFYSRASFNAGAEVGGDRCYFVTIGDVTQVPIKVDSAWITSRSGGTVDPANVSAVNDFLMATDANGMMRWQSYCLGLAADGSFIVKGCLDQQNSATKVAVGIEGANSVASERSGISVKWRIERCANSDFSGEVKTTEPQSSTQFSLPLENDAHPIVYYRGRAVLTYDTEHPVANCSATVVTPATASIVYDKQNHKIIDIVSGSQTPADATVAFERQENGGAWTPSAQAPVAMNVGTYGGRVTVSREAYGPFQQTATLEITPKGATITANDISKNKGEEDPPLTVTKEGVLSGDSITYTSISREAGEAPGEYAITVTGMANQGNYHVNFFGGKFTIIGSLIGEWVYHSDTGYLTNDDQGWTFGKLKPNSPSPNSLYIGASNYTGSAWSLDMSTLLTDTAETLPNTTVLVFDSDKSNLDGNGHSLANSLTDLVLPDGITAIYGNAVAAAAHGPFQHCTALTNVVILSRSLATIGGSGTGSSGVLKGRGMCCGSTSLVNLDLYSECLTVLGDSCAFRFTKNIHDYGLPPHSIFASMFYWWQGRGACVFYVNPNMGWETMASIGGGVPSDGTSNPTQDMSPYPRVEWDSANDEGVIKFPDGLVGVTGMTQPIKLLSSETNIGEDKVRVHVTFNYDNNGTTVGTKTQTYVCKAGFGRIAAHLSYRLATDVGNSYIFDWSKTISYTHGTQVYHDTTWVMNSPETETNVTITIPVKSGSFHLGTWYWMGKDNRYTDGYWVVRIIDYGSYYGYTLEPLWYTSGDWKFNMAGLEQYIKNKYPINGKLSTGPISLSGLSYLKGLRSFDMSTMPFTSINVGSGSSYLFAVNSSSFFSYCTNLKEIRMPESVKNCGPIAGLSSLVSFGPYSQFTSLGEGSFNNCPKLAFDNGVAEFPNVTSIDSTAPNPQPCFNSMTKLEDLKIGSQAKATLSLTCRGFVKDCGNLTNVTISAQKITNYGCMISKSAKLEAVTINAPDGIDVLNSGIGLGDGSSCNFFGLTNLKKIEWNCPPPTQVKYMYKSGPTVAEEATPPIQKCNANLINYIPSTYAAQWNAFNFDDNNKCTQTITTTAGKVKLGGTEYNFRIKQ